jgi:gliding motility-associated-like protein
MKIVHTYLLIFFLAITSMVKSQDVGITAILSPVNGCTIGTDTISITLFNFSAFPVGGTFSLSYSVDGGAPVTESLTTALNPSTSEDYDFVGLFNFTNAGTYNVCATVVFIGDVNATNNTLCVNVINDTLVVGGTITSTSSLVCSGNNSETLTLSGNNNSIINWESSTNGGNPPWNPAAPINSTSSHNFTNITQQTYFHVMIDGGFCPDDTSGVFIVNVDQPSNAGSITGSAVYCSSTNSGQLDVIGVVGSILDWETSTTGIFPGTSTGTTVSSITYTNLSQTTYYQVTAQNGVCPAVTSTIGLVTILPSSAGGNVTGGGLICENGNSGSFALSGFAGDSIYWMYSDDLGATWNLIANNSSTQNYLNITDTTIYCAVVQFTGCPSDTSSFDTLYTIPNPIANAGVDDTIFLGGSTNLNASGGVFYTWIPPGTLTDPNINNPIATPLANELYTVTVADLNGCTDSDNVLIIVIDTNIVIPTDITVCNYITLNGDGLNDVWNITGIDYFTDTEVIVFNNQGQIVYEKTQYMNDWAGTYNGDRLPDGTYFYVVKVSELSKTEKGILTIISKE